MQSCNQDIFLRKKKKNVYTQVDKGNYFLNRL